MPVVLEEEDVDVVAGGGSTVAAVVAGGAILLAAARLGSDLALVRRPGVAPGVSADPVFSAAALFSAASFLEFRNLTGVGGGNFEDLVRRVEADAAAAGGVGAEAAEDVGSLVVPVLPLVPPGAAVFLGATLAVFSTGGSAGTGGSASAISSTPSSAITSASNARAIPVNMPSS